MAQAPRDQNRITTLLATSNADGITPVVLWADPATHRLLVDASGAGMGTVTSVSVVSANGFAGTVATATTTPAITLSTTITGILKGNGTAISAAVSNTDYQAPITLTTTGTSGAATFNGTTLNIPNYTVSGSGLTVGTTTITSGTTTRVLFDNAGVLGEYVISGTGSVAMTTNPVFTTPNLGTPSAATLTNATGLPISSGVSGLAAGIATFLATPSSANLATAVTDETGSGALVFGTTPTLATPVINGLPTGTGIASAATVSTLAARDANGNLAAVNHLDGYTTTTTAAGTTTLTVGSTKQQFFTGSSTQTVVMPVASTLVLGQQFWIVNNSSAAVTIQSSGANNIVVLPGNTAAGSTAVMLTCILTSGTTASSWEYQYYGAVVTSGKLFGVSNSLTLTGTDGSSVAFGTGGTVLYNTSTQTVTNKRITRRFVTTTQSATPTINTDNTDVASITGLAQAITSMTVNLTGTPAAGDFLEVQITDNGTARAITWGTSFAASTVALPTTTVISALLHVLFEWDTVSAKWVCVATA